MIYIGNYKEAPWTALEKTCMFSPDGSDFNHFWFRYMETSWIFQKGFSLSIARKNSLLVQFQVLKTVELTTTWVDQETYECKCWGIKKSDACTTEDKGKFVTISLHPGLQLSTGSAWLFAYFSSMDLAQRKFPDPCQVQSDTPRTLPTQPDLNSSLVSRIFWGLGLRGGAQILKFDSPWILVSQGVPRMESPWITRPDRMSLNSHFAS